MFHQEKHHILVLGIITRLLRLTPELGLREGHTQTGLGSAAGQPSARPNSPPQRRNSAAGRQFSRPLVLT